MNALVTIIPPPAGQVRYRRYVVWTAAAIKIHGRRCWAARRRIQKTREALCN
jgi:hypothetical protein